MATQTWNIDPAHSSVSFTVRHMMIAKVRGTFHQWSGTVTLDGEDFSKSGADVQINAASIDTGEALRDKHLRSADFLDVEKLPALTFTSRRVEGAGDRFKVIGALTLHGITRDVALKVERQGAGKDPWGNERLAFSARTAISRAEFGLKWNQALEAGGVLVSDHVDIEIEISTVKGK